MNLQRTLKNSTVPMPKTLLRMILNATLPRLIQRALLVALPPELGQYLLACKQGIHIAGAAAVHALLKAPAMRACTVLTPFEDISSDTWLSVSKTKGAHFCVPQQQPACVTLQERTAP